MAFAFSIVALVSVFSVFIVSLSSDGSKRELEEGREFVKEVIPLVFTSWNYDELINHSIPELAKIEDMKSTFDFVSGVSGPLKEFELTGTEKGTYSGGAAFTYSASTVFENRPGLIRLTVIERGDTWKIIEWRVNWEP